MISYSSKHQILSNKCTVPSRQVVTSRCSPASQNPRCLLVWTQECKTMLLRTWIQTWGDPLRLQTGTCSHRQVVQLMSSQITKFCHLHSRSKMKRALWCRAPKSKPMLKSISLKLKNLASRQKTKRLLTKTMVFCMLTLRMTSLWFRSSYACSTTSILVYKNREDKLSSKKISSKSQTSLIKAVLKEKVNYFNLLMVKTKSIKFRKDLKTSIFSQTLNTTWFRYRSRLNKLRSFSLNCNYRKISNLEFWPMLSSCKMSMMWNLRQLRSIQELSLNELAKLLN